MADDFDPDAYLKEKQASAPPEEFDPDAYLKEKKQVPSDTAAPDETATPPQPAEQPETRPWARKIEEGVQGAGETLTSVATSIPATLAGGIKGVYKGVAGGKYGTPEGVREAEEEASKFAEEHTYEPKSETGKEYLQKLSDFFSESKLAGLPGATGEVSALGQIPAGVTKAAASQMAEHPAVKTLIATGGRVSPAAKKIASYISPKPTEQTIALAKKADEMGIPLRPDMLYDNRVVNMIGEALEKVPLSGSKKELRREAFNRAIMKEIGADPTATKLTPDVFDQAIRKSGQAIGDISEKTNIPIDYEFFNALKEHALDAARYDTPDVAKIVGNYIEDLGLKAKYESGGHHISGEAFRKINTKINNQIRNTSNGDLKHSLSLLQEDMHDALERNLSPKDRIALADARKKYAYAKLLEPLVAKSTEGDISPAGLMGAVTATKSQKSMMARGKGGKLADIAKVGQRFVREPPSSGTAERSLGYGILGGGLATHPATVGGVYSLANVYNRLGAPVTKQLLKMQSAFEKSEAAE